MFLRTLRCGNRLKGLKHHSDVPAYGVDVPDVVGQLYAVYDYLALLVFLQPVEHPDESGFAEPDGPNTTTTCPLLISVEIPLMTWKSPNHL